MVQFLVPPAYRFTSSQLLSLHEQITGSDQLESMLEGFKSCMPMYTK